MLLLPWLPVAKKKKLLLPLHLPRLLLRQLQPLKLSRTRLPVLPLPLPEQHLLQPVLLTLPKAPPMLPRLLQTLLPQR